MDNEFDDFQSFKPAKIEPDEFKPEKEKKKDDPLMTVCLIWFVLGVVFFLVIGSVAYVPSGKVLDDRFLNTLKYMTLLKYLIPISALIALFVPLVKRSVKVKDKKVWKYIIMTVVIFGIAFFLSTRGKFSSQGVANAFTDTPAVVSKTVTDKKHSVRGHTYTVYFDDNTFAHVNHYHYKGLSSGDEVYVVYCDNTAIGVFKTSEYSLP